MYILLCIVAIVRNSKRYSMIVEEAGITSVLKYGVAFFGKYVEVELG
jgi:hypothetical protein